MADIYELEGQISEMTETEFNSPTNDFGTRLKTFIANETGEVLPYTLEDEINTWQSLGFSHWGELIRWVWNKIKKWWKELWE